MPTMNDPKGFLFIGDPHLSSRNPGYRRDDYPLAILGKLRFALDVARGGNLIPVLLGDLFHWPRDNSNWLLSSLLELFSGTEILAVTGNHDTTERTLKPDDSLAVIAASGHLRLLDQTGPWVGTINGRTVVIGATAWSDRIPTSHDDAPAGALVVWLTHHNVGFPGAGEDWLKPHEIPGIDLVVNGHIHRHLEDQRRGRTLWINPGNIARVARADAVRDADIAVTQMEVTQDGFELKRIPVPFASFDDVFHLDPATEEIPVSDASAFVKGLESLKSLRTQGGVGLLDFLEENLGRYETNVAEEIRNLAKEVCKDGQ